MMMNKNGNRTTTTIAILLIATATVLGVVPTTMQSASANHGGLHGSNLKPQVAVCPPPTGSGFVCPPPHDCFDIPPKS